MTRRPTLQWSYTAGERGRNRVRAFAHRETGRMFLEFREAGRRTRVALGHRDREAAKIAAEQAALALRADHTLPAGALRLGTLFDIYEREVTPQKGASARGHDRGAIARFTECWGANREVSTLSRREWDRYIGWRREAGDRRPHMASRRELRGNRVIVQDLKFIRAVLNWATQAGDGQGNRLLDRNPLDKLPYPPDVGVRRPTISSEVFARLREVAARVSPLCPLLLMLVHETGHRVGAVRLLRWTDVDLTHRSVRWAFERDKSRYEHETPLSETAMQWLTSARRKRSAIGDAWIFPAPGRAGHPVTRHRVRTWWDRMEVLAGLEPDPGRGWHSLRRKFATELKGVPLRDLAHLGGWKSPATILKCYQKPDDATMRDALASRGTLTGEGMVSVERTPRMDTTRQKAPKTEKPAGRRSANGTILYLVSGPSRS
jgi:integrase